MNLKQALIYNLEELQSSVQILTNEEYTSKMEILSGSSIGQHYRHLIEFLLCLNESLISGVVDYDARKRDLEIEESPVVALQKIEAIKEWLENEKGNRNLSLHVSYGYENPEETILDTDLFRELAYNLEHCVHHMALIKIGFRQLGKQHALSSHFGVASSTTRHHQSSKA